MKSDKWTTENIPDLTGKTIVVTGGNSGLGYESVKAFAQKGAQVILACRDIQKGEAATKQIGKIAGEIIVMPLDLADFSSIKTFAELYISRSSKLDVLLNNAGIMTTPYFLTKDGLEAQNGVNHFGHFLLTSLLFETLKSTPGARIINVASAAHKWGKMDFENPLFENGKDYTPMKSYGRSKLSNLLFTYELDRRIKTNGLDMIAAAAHPGGSNTNLARYVDNKLWFKILTPLFSIMMQSAAQGALPEIRAAVDPNVNGAQYYGPHKGMTGDPVVVDSNDSSKNIDDAKKLWELSEKITDTKLL